MHVRSKGDNINTIICHIRHWQHAHHTSYGAGGVLPLVHIKDRPLGATHANSGGGGEDIPNVGGLKIYLLYD